MLKKAANVNDNSLKPDGLRMKGKEGGGNMENALSQLQNLRLSEPVAMSLFKKIRSCNNLSNVQRMKALKVAALYCDKEGCSSELRLDALCTGLALVKADFVVSNSPANGAAFAFIEACFKIVKTYAESNVCQHIDVVVKALDVLSILNSATASKLFHDEGGITFKKIVAACLKNKDLKMPCLALISMCLGDLRSGMTEVIMEDSIPFIQMIYPLLFTLDDSELQGAALKVIQRLIKNKSDSWTSLPSWNQMKEDTRKVYYKDMISMVEKKQNWPDIWRFVVNMFGQELHSGGQLINHMLEVLEKAFKHPDFYCTRVQAFSCWETLIDNFKTGLGNKKRIDLIMIPLKANNHRVEALALAKLKTYEHLLKTLGKELISAPDILLCFLSFCFGPEKSCFPVKSYPALHESCAKCIYDVLSSSYAVEIFPKVNKELIGAVGDCFIMQNVSAELLAQIWDQVLELVQKVDMTEIFKNLLTVVNNLVVQAGGVPKGGGLSSPSGTLHSNLDLCQRLVSIVFHGIVHSKFALKSNLHIGSHDVMTNTPSLLVIEWLLTPALVLSAGSTSKFMGLIMKVISLQTEGLCHFMDFVHFTLKKLLVIDDTVPLSRHPQLFKTATDVWCTLVEETVKFVQSEGTINQGDAAEHDFSALYAVLVFPAQNLYVDLQLINRCSEPWSSLFYEACQQAALIPTTNEQHLWEQVCIRLLGLIKRNGGRKQLASVYHFLTLIMQVAIEKFHSVKRLRQVQTHVSVTLKELLNSAFDQEVFNQAVSCVKHCLHPNTVSIEVISNVSPTICALLQSRVNTYDPVDKLCNLLNALKQASTHLNQHSSSKVAVASLLQGIVQAGKCHPCQKVRSTLREICDASDEKKTSEKETKSPNVSNSTVLSPSNRSPKNFVSVSPKPSLKKTKAILMSPSNLSPSNTKRKLQTAVCGADGNFVRIETPPKIIILTEHQKEVRRERRQDIPALYQDLSQDTQSLSQDTSQDCVALPTTPRKETESAMHVDEDAVMDIVDVDPSVQVSCSKFQSPQRTESPRSSTKLKQSLQPKNDARSFTPPAGFILPSSAKDCSPKSESKGIITKEHVAKQDNGAGKGCADGVTSVKSDSLITTSRCGALTRSSSNTDIRTRSGKILKRNSEAPDKVKKKFLPSRKSVPSSCSDELSKKNMVETIVIESDNTDTESISSATSDVSSSSARPFGVISRRRRSQKSLFQESGSDWASTVDSRDSISRNGITDVLHTGSPKLQKSAEPKALIAEQQSKTDEKQNQPPTNKVGGKILTRSRSNSSLDEVLGLAKKQKDLSGSNLPLKSTSLVEASPKVKDFSTASPSNSPRKKSLGFEILSGMSDGKPDFIQDCPGKKATGDELKSNSSQTLVEKPDVGLLVKSNGLQGSSEKSPVSSKEEGVLINKSHGKAKTTSSLSTNVSGVDPEHGTEESQEIIESSQDPLLNLLKPCLVSLQQFKCSNVQQLTQIEDVIVEKGPDDKSPYKVRSKETQVSPTASSSTRRSLNLDTEKATCPMGKPRIISSVNTSALSTESIKSTASAVSDEVQPVSVDTLLEESANDGGGGNDSMKIISINIEKEPGTAPSNNKEAKNDAKPDWMHVKKNSSPSKVLSKMSSTSARRQAFMKSVRDAETSSSPPKGMDVSPMSSPIQSKRASRSVDSGNSTPIIIRSSRAAQILGLGQAAAARGGDKVVASAARSGEAVDENESTISRSDSISSSSVEVSSSITSSSMSNFTNMLADSMLPSPSIRRQSKLHELDTQKSTPQKCLEDAGLKEDWVPRTPCATTATPDSSILKRKRENDTDASSPSVKRKRVSFRDPPLSSMLKFGEFVDIPGTVFSSDQSDGADTSIGPSIVNLESINTGKVGNKHSKTEDKAVQQKLGEGIMVPETNGQQFGKSCESNEVIGSSDGDTQGMLDDLQHIPSCLSSVYPSLIRCTHPVAGIVAKLTTPVWEKSLMRELSSHGVDTIGDLAKLKENEIDRLPVKPPKKTNVNATLEDFENRHSSLKDGFLCGLNEVQCKATNGLPETCVELTDVLTNASIKDVVKALTQLGKGAELLQLVLKSQEPEDVAAAVTSNEKILKALPMNLVVNSNDPQHVAAVVSSNAMVLKCIPIDAVVNSNDPKDVATVVCSKPQILQSLPVDIVINSFQSQNVAAFVSSNPNILKLLPLGMVINVNEPGDVAAIVSCNPKILKSLPVDVVINHNQPQNVAEIVSLNKKILECLPLDDVVNLNQPLNVAEIVNSNQHILKSVSLERLFKSKKAQDVAEIVSLNKEILKSLPFDAVLKANEPQDVATVISSYHQILKCLPIDAVADIYISKACSSSGKREEDMSVEELKWILSKVPKDVIMESICPSVPSSLSSCLKDAQRDYALKQCHAAEIVEHLDSDKANQIFKSLLSKTEPQSIAGHLDSTRSKETIEALLPKLNPKECLQFLSAHVYQLSLSL